MELQGSRTAINLLTAFAGESQARNRYSFAASIARKEGLGDIAALFEETALNEKEHAKLFFKLLAPLAPTAIEIKALATPSWPGTRQPNSKPPWKGRSRNTPRSIRSSPRSPVKKGLRRPRARLNWWPRWSRSTRSVVRRLWERVTQGTLFAREEKIAWRCRNCGHIHLGSKAPGMCPVCQHSQAFFEPVGENF